VTSLKYNKFLILHVKDILWILKKTLWIAKYFSWIYLWNQSLLLLLNAMCLAKK